MAKNSASDQGTTNSPRSAASSKDILEEIMRRQENKPTELADKQRRLLEKLQGEESDFTLQLLAKAGMPLTRENYLGLAYPEGVPDDLDEMSLPSQIRK